MHLYFSEYSCFKTQNGIFFPGFVNVSSGSQGSSAVLRNIGCLIRSLKASGDYV